MDYKKAIIWLLDHVESVNALKCIYLYTHSTVVNQQPAAKKEAAVNG